MFEKATASCIVVYILHVGFLIIVRRFDRWDLRNLETRGPEAVAPERSKGTT